MRLETQGGSEECDKESEKIIYCLVLNLNLEKSNSPSHSLGRGA